uniref:Uncharacterized protein n=1 Tax=Strongyloides venezuelensis TaxID=75913 RepID=A0A0K0F214_STRVS
MTLFLELFVLLVSTRYISLGKEVSNYNYRYLYSGLGKENRNSGSFHISMASDGRKNKWKTVINDDGNIEILEKVPVLKNIINNHKSDEKFNIVHGQNIRRKEITNYRRSPIIYEWTSPSDSKETLFNTLPSPALNNVNNMNSKSFKRLESNEILTSPENTFMTQPLNQKHTKFLQPREFFNSNFNHKMDFSIPWFGARFFERHQPIPESTSPQDFVRQHTINSYGNGKLLFNEMQEKLNTLFKDLNF